MNRFNIQHPRRRVLPWREHGSVTILVVVVLVVMALMGIAYLQMARLGRVATEQQTGTGIDTVMSAVIASIGNTLGRDLYDSEGKFFNQSPAAADEGGVESYDFDFTNTANTVRNTLSVLLQDGSTALPAPLGGDGDDMWLASVRPEFTANPTWPHLTNLTGLFLRLPSDTGAGQPAEDVVNFSGGAGSDLCTDTGVLITGSGVTLESNVNASGATDAAFLPLGFDADGDGVLDSRWTWAPIRQLGSVQYVMAVRIIDNGALVNVNVGTSQVTGGGALTAGAYAPRWWYPSELDLGGFVYSFGGGASDMTELAQLLNYRMNTGALPSPFGTASGQRAHYWLNGPALWANFSSPYRSLSIADEIELRYRNGLNNNTVTAQIEHNTQGMPDFLKADDVSTTYYDYMGGSAGAAAMQSYFENNPRLQLTAHNGAGVFAPNLPGEDTRQLKSDLNQLLTAATPAADLAAQIIKVFDTPVNDISLPANCGTLQEYADQLAVNLVDYADDDGGNSTQLTELNGRYGMEAMPFITEIYRQRAYQTVWVDNGDNTWDQRWVKLGVTGYAIELRNPFAREIQLQGIFIKIGAAAEQELHTLTGQAAMAPGEVIVLFSNSGGGQPDDNVANLIGGTTTNVAVGAQADFETNVVVPVVLRVNTTASRIDYQRTTVALIDDSAAMVAAAAIPFSSGGPNPDGGANGDPTATPAYAYKQRSNYGNGNGLNMMTITDGVFAGATRGIPDPSTGAPAPPPVSLTIEALGVADKTAGPYGGPGGNASSTLALQQIVISNLAAFTEAGEIAHVAVFGPSAGNDLPDAWTAAANPSNIESLMLDFDPSTAGKIDSGTPNLNVTHAAFLLDRFTTLSPANDGENNDNDTNTADADEQFVPGVINLNTIPRDVLALVLPLGDATVRGNVADAIVAYRNAPTARGAVPLQGIAYVGELVDVLKNELTTGSQVGDTSMLGGVEVDFLNPDAAIADGIADDREEAAMLARYLGQVASTRSDVFTAYVVIRGYPAGNFSAGPVEYVQFYAVFDRSMVKDQADSVRLIGLYRFPQP